MSMNVQSINQLVGTGTIAFNDLQSITNGKYNMGEVQAVIGQDKVKFAKVNNHVSMTRYNNVVSTPEQNLKTNAAIFKAIATEFGKDVQGDRLDDLFTKGLSTIKVADESASDVADDESFVEMFEGPEPDDVLNDFHNPYVKEAFKFLLTGGNQYRSVSRDEIHMLLDKLGSYKHGANVSNDMQKLAELRNFKETGTWSGGSVAQNNLQDDYLFGWNHAVGDNKTSTLSEVSKNQKEFAYLKKFQEWQSKAITGAYDERRIKRCKEFLDKHPEICIAMAKEVDKYKDINDWDDLDDEKSRKIAVKMFASDFAERFSVLRELQDEEDKDTFASIASYGLIEVTKEIMNVPPWSEPGEESEERKKYVDYIKEGFEFRAQ